MKTCQEKRETCKDLKINDLGLKGVWDLKIFKKAVVHSLLKIA